MTSFFQETSLDLMTSIRCMLKNLKLPVPYLDLFRTPQLLRYLSKIERFYPRFVTDKGENHFRQSRAFFVPIFGVVVHDFCNTFTCNPVVIYFSLRNDYLVVGERCYVLIF